MIGERFRWNITYTYSIIAATDWDKRVLTTDTHTFTTKVPTSKDSLSNPSQSTTRKVSHSGQVYIIRDNKTYNITTQKSGGDVVNNKELNKVNRLALLYSTEASLFLFSLFRTILSPIKPTQQLIPPQQ